MDYQKALESTIGIPFYTGNSIKVLKNGVQIFPAMLDAIKNAKEQIDFLTFVYWKGDIAHHFAKELSRKAEEGLRVRVILDSFGAAFMPDELTSIMKKSGVQLEWFRPIPQWKVWKTDNRTHRKILICDCQVAFTGGVGIAEEWEGDARNSSEWRETHFCITGPAVKGLQAAFLENWIEMEHAIDLNHLWIDQLSSVKTLPENTFKDGVSIQVIRTAASVRWSDIVMLYESLIRMAQCKIRITTAYFNPNRYMIKLLCDAARRGVDIKIMIPGKHIDTRVANIAGADSFEALLDVNIELYFYQKTMLHSKIILIDDYVCCVGSANFNHRSMLKDDEMNMVVIDEYIASILTGHFKEDLNHCESVQEDRWKRRSFVQRGLESMTKLFKQQI